MYLLSTPYQSTPEFANVHIKLSFASTDFDITLRLKVSLSGTNTYISAKRQSSKFTFRQKKPIFLNNLSVQNWPIRSLKTQLLTVRRERMEKDGGKIATGEQNKLCNFDINITWVWIMIICSAVWLADLKTNWC